MTDKQPLSGECRAVADALMDLRARLIHLLHDKQLPPDLWADVSIVQLSGLEVADALERLASDRV